MVTHSAASVTCDAAAGVTIDPALSEVLPEIPAAHGADVDGITRPHLGHSEGRLIPAAAGNGDGPA